MKKNILILFIPFMLFAQTYMGKIEPYEKYTIYSQTSGQIVKLNKNDETKIVNKKLIELDSSLEKSQLAIYKKQLSLYLKKLAILEKSYLRYIKIKGKSQSDKDDKLYTLIELKISIESLKFNIKNLEDVLKKKNIYVNDLYIKEFKINKGDYVSVGSALATAYDMKKAKIVIYVSADDFFYIKNKEVLINKTKSLATIEKVDKTIDEVYISGYKVTLLIDSKEFGKAVSVEFVK